MTKKPPKRSKPTKSTRKPTARRPAADATVEQTVTVAWHKPRCSACDEPIANIRDALAVWYDSEDGNHSPMLVHVGACWQSLPKRSMSIHVDRFRRVPLEAVIVALRRHANGEAERLVWHSWINVVLGLPIGDRDSLLPGGEIADHVDDRVMTLEEARKLTGEEA